MVLGKYYCDYCDKQFKDTPGARKRHLEGLQHQRSKALWYQSFPPTPPPTPPIPHQKVFYQCGGADSSNYLHPNPNNNNNNNNNNHHTTQLIEPTSFPGVIHHNHNNNNNNMMTTTTTTWTNLPPSLMPPPDGGYPPLPFLDWGT